jgi:hemerythrin-like metal-binding protein
MGGYMAQFIWKDGFSIGIEEIDNQHKLFMEYLNECSELATRSSIDGIYKGLIDKTKAYATMHFAFEENLMHINRYPELAQHEKLHRFFEMQVAELEASFNTGGREKTTSLSAFLRDWYINHILEEDKKYAPYVAQS